MGNSTQALRQCPTQLEEIRYILKQDVLSSIVEHRSLVVAIRSISEFPASRDEIAELAEVIEMVSADPGTASVAATRIFARSVRFQVTAIHLTRECDQGAQNALSDWWNALKPPVQSQLMNAIYGPLVVLRERARRAHNTTPTQLEEQIDTLMQKLEALPAPVRHVFVDAALNDTLTVSPVVLINKLVMLQEEYPDDLQVMLDELVA